MRRTLYNSELPESRFFQRLLLVVAVVLFAGSAIYLGVLWLGFVALAFAALGIYAELQWKRAQGR